MIGDTLQNNKILHKGLLNHYKGSFLIVSRPTRSTVEIKVGLTKGGDVIRPMELDLLAPKQVDWNKT